MRDSVAEDAVTVCAFDVRAAKLARDWRRTGRSGPTSLALGGVNLVQRSTRYAASFSAAPNANSDIIGTPKRQLVKRYRSD